MFAERARNDFYANVHNSTCLISFEGFRHWTILAPQNDLMIVQIAYYIMHMTFSMHWRKLSNAFETLQHIGNHCGLRKQPFLERLYNPKLNSFIFVRNGFLNMMNIMKNQSLKVYKVIFNVHKYIFHFQLRLVSPRKYFKNILGARSRKQEHAKSNRSRVKRL